MNGRDFRLKKRKYDKIKKNLTVNPVISSQKVGFSVSGRQICRKYVTDMKEGSYYESVCGMVNDARVLKSRRTDFRSVCMRAGADEVSLSNMFYRNFGMSGDDVLEALRTGRMKK